MSSRSSWEVTAEESARLARMSPKEAFGLVMGELAERDHSLTVVVSDYGRRLNLDHMREALPEGYVQCGIAEQNQVEVAAALANEGFTVFAPCYATFVTGRALDQVRVNLGMMGSPVALVGVSAGCESGALGASHMALEDVALMRCVPKMSVFCPSDNAEFASVLRYLAANPRPAYVRMDALDGVNLHPDGVTWEPGRAERLYPPAPAAGPKRDAAQDSADAKPQATRPQVTIFSTGAIASRAVEAARELERRGVTAEAVELGVVKPLDVTAIDAATAGRRLIVTLEEHGVVGGLGGAVAERMAGLGGSPALLRLGMPDRYLEADGQQELLERAGLTADGIVCKVVERL